MNRVRRALVLGLAPSLALAACGRLVAAPPPAWQSPLQREHPLSGRIWDVAARRFIDRTTLAERLAAARFVLLGEKHDNADHHRLQAWAVESLTRAARRPTVAFEMLSIDDTALVERHLAGAPGDAAGLGAAVRWEESGWPPWPLYEPIAEAALAARLPIVGADLTRTAVRAVQQRGFEALDAAFVARTGLDRALPPPLHTAVANEIREAHCGYAPESLLDKMIAVQRARDARMADTLASVGARDGAVLIAGGGHVPKDYAVPTYLERLSPGARIVALAFLEVRGGRAEPEPYLERPVDYAWFTPRVDDDDPCEQFKRPLERLRERRSRGARG